MGCDYYVIKQLKIYHCDGVDTIELDREKCYFPTKINNNDNYDSDDSENKSSNNSYEEFLKVTFKPRILYNDEGWKNDKVREKYIDMIYNKLKKYNNAYHNIFQIIKEEVRYLR